MTSLKKYFRLSVVLGVVLIVLLSFTLLAKAAKRKAPSSLQVTSAPAKATAAINKSFQFQAINAAKEFKPVTYTITTVDRKDEIKVKDKSRQAAAGKDFLLVRIEIQNDLTERLAIVSADRIRLEDQGKLFAPDYHNGNVVIDPLSVRRDVLAFVVDANTKNFVFSVGELAGDKQKLEVNF